MMDCFKINSSEERLSDMLRDLISTLGQLSVTISNGKMKMERPLHEEFMRTLFLGLDLVEKCKKMTVTKNPIKMCKYACQMKKLEHSIEVFFKYQLPSQLLLSVNNVMVELKNFQRAHEFESSKTIQENSMENACIVEKINVAERGVTFGMAKSLWTLKKMLLKKELSVIGLQSMGGSGKTTLALKIYQDKEIQGIFRDNVVFITVSQSPNMKLVLENMWDKLVQTKRPEFQNAEDAHLQLKQQIMKQTRPALVVLDDVWSRENLETLMFERHGYKTLVTTRDSCVVPKIDSCELHQLPLLNDSESANLLYFWAFGKTSIPESIDEDFVKKVQDQCNGLPLALKVIGSSLQSKPTYAWEMAIKKLSSGRTISDYHKDMLLKSLEKSIDVLNDKSRQCFFDLAAFPDETKINVDALLNMWVYVRKMEWQDAFDVLQELCHKNLLNLSRNGIRDATMCHGKTSDMYFSIHKQTRYLALFLASRDKMDERRRLILLNKDGKMPTKWEMLKNQPLKAQIVSIHTDELDRDSWDSMHFSEAEALVLTFSASEYFIPNFMRSMKNLKVLIVLNYGPKRATLQNISSLHTVACIKAIHFERMVCSQLQDNLDALKGLEKLSLSLCEGFRGMTSSKNSQIDNMVHALQDINLDCCIDLETLPSMFLGVSSIQTLSITNCHILDRLPYALGNLKSLKKFSLSACLSLKELPSSIGELSNLEYLDISQCERLQDFPDEIGMLTNLKEIDMRQCCQMMKLPKSMESLKSLKHVICDEKISHEWLQIKNCSIAKLNVEVMGAQFNLEWLDS